MTYWDTSARLKLYVPEPDSAYFLNLVALGGQPVSYSSIATLEVLCAVHRKEQAGDLKPGSATSILRKFRVDCREGRIVLVPYGEDVLGHSEQVVRLAVRSR